MPEVTSGVRLEIGPDAASGQQASPGGAHAPGLSPPCRVRTSTALFTPVGMHLPTPSILTHGSTSWWDRGQIHWGGTRLSSSAVGGPCFTLASAIPHLVLIEGFSPPLCLCLHCPSPGAPFPTSSPRLIYLSFKAQLSFVVISFMKILLDP